MLLDFPAGWEQQTETPVCVVGALVHKMSLWLFALLAISSSGDQRQQCS